MSLNALGLGLVFTAKDLATGVMRKVREGVVDTYGASNAMVKQFDKNQKVFMTGLAMMGAGAAGLSLLDDAAASATAFGKSIALVASETTEAQFKTEDMKAISLDLAQQFGRMPTDEAAAMYKAVALGANTATKATDFLTGANRLAVAGNSDLTTTTDALGGAMNAYHLKAGDAGRISDAFFNAMKGGNTTVGEMAGAIGKVGAGAYEMGMSVEDTLGSMSVMTNKGLKASEAVSMLHGAMSNIVHPSKDAETEAKRLGIQFDAAAVRSMGWKNFLHSIADNSKLTKDSLSKLFGSVEGSTGMAMLAGDIGAVDATLQNMQDGVGATKTGFDILSNTVAFQEDRFKALAETVKIDVGEVVDKAKVQFLQLANGILEAFHKIPAPIRDFIVRAAMMATTLLTVVGGVLALSSGVGLLMTGLKGLGLSMSGVFAALGPVALVLGVVALAVYAFKRAVDLNIGGIGDRFNGLVSNVKLFFTAITQLFTDGGFSGAVREEFLKGENPVINFAIRVWLWVNKIKNFFMGIGEGFSAALVAAQPAFTAFGEALDGLAAAFGIAKNDPKEAGASYDSFGAAGKSVGDIIGKVAEVIVRISTVFIEMVTCVMKVVDALGGIDTILTVVKYALIAAAFYGAAQLTMSLVALATQAGTAAIAVGTTLVAGLMKMNLANGGQMAANIVSGLMKIGPAALASLGPVAALAAAFAALYLAIDQAIKLYKEWDENSSSQIMTELKHDIGITSDAEYEAEQNKRMGLVTGKEYDYQSEVNKRSVRVPMQAAPAGYTPDSSPAVASIMPPNQSSMDPAAMGAAIGAAAKQAVGAQGLPPLNVTMQVDGEVLGRVQAKGLASSMDGAGLPVSMQE